MDQPLPWDAIYGRLSADREDQVAWLALAGRVKARARWEFGHLGHDTIDDAVADVCATVAITLDRAHGPSTFAGFVLGHYLNVRRQVMRTATRRGVDLDSVEPATADTDHQSEAAIVDELYRVLAELTPRLRTAVLLRYAEELPPAIIAARLGTSEANARQLVHRGLEELRRRLVALNEKAAASESAGHAR